jgi:hypothetical protein
MPKNYTTPTSSLSIVDAVRTFKSPSTLCPDWCFITFHSYSIWNLEQHRDNVVVAPKNRIADRFKVRKAGEEATTSVWKKSLAKTKNAFNAGCKFDSHNTLLPQTQCLTS